MLFHLSPCSPHKERTSQRVEVLPHRMWQAFHKYSWSRLLYATVVILCLMSLFFADVLGNSSTVSAATTTKSPPTLAVAKVNNTLQDFLKQGKNYQAFAGMHVGPASQSALTSQGNAGKGNSDATVKALQTKPSAEPPSMTKTSASIPSSALNQTRTSSNIPSYITGSSTTTTPALHLVGRDTGGVRMELNIPAGALDFSAAKTAAGAAVRGPLTITLSQTRGYYFAATLDLATYQITITDATGAQVQGISLRVPVTYVFHYRQSEIKDVGIDPSRLSVRWEKAPIASLTPTNSRNNVSPTTTLKNNTAALTISATSNALIPLATVSDGTSAIENPPKARFASVQGNSGQLSYAYPLTVAPGPNGTTPSLSLSYSSGTTNARHAPTSPSGSAGDGWTLSMGEITSEQETASSVTSTIYSLSGIDGVSDRLLPNSSNGTTGTLDYQTEHPSYFRIKRVDPVTGSATGQHYFLVWDKDGNEYEFGNTTDSLQYSINSSTTQINYAYALDKVILANNGSATRTITITYVQDKETGTVSTSNSTQYTWIRDFALKRITYGTTANGNTTLAGTVDFLYNGPVAYTDSSNNVQYITAYTTAYQTACSLPATTTPIQRCDDPLDKTVSGTEYKDPDVMSTLELTGIKSYVGSDTTGSLDSSYALTYTDNAFSSCSGLISDSSTLSNYYCAGDHLLTKIVPTIYLAGTGHALPGMTFGYSGLRTNQYYDSSQTYEMQNKWNYLTSYHDLSNGVGATSIVWNTAWNNSNGTPVTSAGDNRYDALYCTWNTSGSSSCTNSPWNHANEKIWTEQVVTEVDSQGKDSSSSSLTADKTTYDYWLTKTGGSCNADSTGNSDCVGYGWMPSSSDSSTYVNYYNSEFRGFGTILTVNLAGNLTVQKYATTYGWNSSMTDARNYLAGSLLEEDTFSGPSLNCSNLLTQTLNNYAGEAIQTQACGSSPFSSTVTSCTSTYVKNSYTACEAVLLATRTIDWESTGTAGPYVEHDYTYDDYRISTAGLGSYYASPATGSYHNMQQEVITSSNASTLTKKWTYDTTNTTVSSVVYYNVNKVAHSEVDDSSGIAWKCSDTTYDEGVASGVPTPLAGWPTTMKTYSTCGTSSTAITSYAGYDTDGNAVSIVDGLGATNSSVKALYTTGSTGCTLSTAPAYLSANWTGGNYTSCTTFSSANAQPTKSTNALNQSTTTAYDATQGLLPTSTVDANSQTTSRAYSYDSSGNSIVQITSPGETGSYTLKGTIVSNCTNTSTTPCQEVDNNSFLYGSTVGRAYYDSQGRKVETQTPGPGSTNTTVSFTVYNDTNNSVFTSQPIVLTARTTWLDPNDSSVASLGGTTTYMDATGRTIATVDALFQNGGNAGTACPSLAALTANWTTQLTRATTCMIYSYGTSGVSSDSNSYAITTTIDANSHEGKSYTDALGRTIYTFAYSGLSTGTLTAVKRMTTIYNVLDKPTSVTVTDLIPQTNQTITSVTTTATYDSLGRVISGMDPDRGSSTTTYDVNSNIIGVTTTSGSSTKVMGTKYDMLGRVGCVQSSIPATTDVSVRGACTSGATPYQTATYDANPSGITWTNYPVGKLTQNVTYTYYSSPDSATGTVTEAYQYDQRGRAITKQLNLAVSGTGITFPTFPIYQESQTYNDISQPITTTTSSGGTTDYAFTNTYDSTTGTASGLTNGSTALASLSYNTRGLVSALTLDDSTGTSLATKALTYDGDLRLANAATTWTSGGSTVYSDGVAYDNVGNVLSRATTHATMSNVSGSGGTEVQNFCYSEQNEMVWASNAATGTTSTGQTCGTTTVASTLGSSYTNTYAYTHLGQLWQAPLNGNGTQEQYLYCNTSSPHQLTALSPSSASPTCSSTGTTAYTASYDAWGNLTSRVYPTTTTSVPVYDIANQMIRWSDTTSSSTDEEWYLYDASGNRIMRRSASTTLSGNPATSAATITIYAFGLEEHTYSYAGSGTSLTNTGNTYYYSLGGRLIGFYNGTNTNLLLTDLLGSVVSSISNTAGSAAILGERLYGPFGNQRYSAGSVSTAKGFTGQYNDGLTGLDYYNARYYDPVSGRFTVTDTVQGNAQGFDPYAYVSGNPETSCDPTGQADYNASYVVAWYRAIHGVDFVQSFDGGSFFSSKLPNGTTPDILNNANGAAWDAKTGAYTSTTLPGYEGFEATLKGTLSPDITTIWDGSNRLQNDIAGSGYQPGSTTPGEPGYDSGMANFFNTSPTCLWQIECYVFYADGSVLLVSTPTITVSPKENSVHLVRGIIAYSIVQGTIDRLSPKQVITYQHYQQLYPAQTKKIPQRPQPFVIVQPGDTLWSISSSVYGSGSQWNTLFQKNSGTIVNPNLIFAGERLYY